MRSPVKWLSDHPWIATSFIVGAFVGALTRLPLLPPLADATATMIGSALGAGLAVWGAQWILTERHRVERRLSRDSIIELMRPFTSRLTETIEACRSFTDPDDSYYLRTAVVPIVDAGEKLLQALHVFIARFQNMRELFDALGPPGVLAYGDLSRLSKLIQDEAHELASLATASKSVISNQIQSSGGELEDARREIREVLRTLSS